jgi:hypothetical protein
MPHAAEALPEGDGKIDELARLSAIEYDRCLQRHVVLTPDQALTVPLWIMMAWAQADAAIYSPILMATSPEANSGKTTLLNLVASWCRGSSPPLRPRQRIFVNAAIKKRRAARPEPIAPGSRKCGHGGGMTTTFTSAYAARATAPNARLKRRQAEAMAAARTSIIGSPTLCRIPSRLRGRRCLSRASPCRACPRRAVQG